MIKNVEMNSDENCCLFVNLFRLPWSQGFVVSTSNQVTHYRIIVREVNKGTYFINVQLLYRFDSP